MGKACQISSAPRQMGATCKSASARNMFDQAEHSTRKQAVRTLLPNCRDRPDSEGGGDQTESLIHRGYIDDTSPCQHPPTPKAAPPGRVLLKSPMLHRSVPDPSISDSAGWPIPFESGRPRFPRATRWAKNDNAHAENSDEEAPSLKESLCVSGTFSALAAHRITC